ncbi:TPA: hypothetical protein ACL51Z_001940, partial [Streptococcus pneumoniae]
FCTFLVSICSNSFKKTDLDEIRSRLRKDSYDATFEEKVMRRLNMLEKQQELIYELLLKAYVG